MNGSIRLSLTREVPATSETYQILEYNILDEIAGQNCYRSESNDETEEFLYKIMERYDDIADFNVYSDDLLSSLPVLVFLRDQNPSKPINLFWLEGGQAEPKIYQSYDETPEFISKEHPELEDIFAVVDTVSIIPIKLVV